MKFYVIFGIDPTTICSTSNVFVSDDLEEAYKYFLKSKTELPKGYNYSYLIVDFGIYKSNIFKYTSIDPEADVFPFIIIAEYDKFHDDYNVREDTIVIKTPGICEEFSNNKAAIERFIELYRSKSIATLGVRYIFNEKEYEAVSVTTNAMYRLDKPSYIKNIKISPLMIKPNNSIKERLFSKQEYIDYFSPED